MVSTVPNSFLIESSHLSFLDLYAADQTELSAYQSAYAARVELHNEIARLSMDESEKLRRTEMLRHQIEEIERAGLHPGEDTELEERRKLLQNSEKLMDSLAGATAALDGTDDMPALPHFYQMHHAFWAAFPITVRRWAHFQSGYNHSCMRQQTLEMRFARCNRTFPIRLKNWSRWSPDWISSTGCAKNTAWTAKKF